MEALSKLWRRVNRFYFFILAKVLSFFWRRQITINHIQSSGEEGIGWSLSFQVETILPGRIFHNECVRFSPFRDFGSVTLKSIELAEDLCKEHHLKMTPIYIKNHGDTIIVFVEANK